MSEWTCSHDFIVCSSSAILFPARRQWWPDGAKHVSKGGRELKQIYFVCCSISSNLFPRTSEFRMTRLPGPWQWVEKMAMDDQVRSRETHLLLPWTKKKNHHWDLRREERCSTCDIMLDQARSAQGKSDPRLSATFALRWSCLIEHDITCGTAFFSPRISMMVLFFCPG